MRKETQASAHPFATLRGAFPSFFGHNPRLFLGVGFPDNQTHKYVLQRPAGPAGRSDGGGKGRSHTHGMTQIELFTTTGARPRPDDIAQKVPSFHDRRPVSPGRRGRNLPRTPDLSSNFSHPSRRSRNSCKVNGRPTDRISQRSFKNPCKVDASANTRNNPRKTDPQQSKTKNLTGLKHAISKLELVQCVELERVISGLWFVYTTEYRSPHH